MELLGLLAHVDDVVLTEHLGGVSLVTTRSAEGLACNIQMDSDGFNLASNIQMDSDGFNLPSTVRWIKLGLQHSPFPDGCRQSFHSSRGSTEEKIIESLRLRQSTQSQSLHPIANILVVCLFFSN